MTCAPESREADRDELEPRSLRPMPPSETRSSRSIPPPALPAALLAESLTPMLESDCREALAKCAATSPFRLFLRRAAPCALVLDPTGPAYALEKFEPKPNPAPPREMLALADAGEKAALVAGVAAGGRGFGYEELGVVAVVLILEVYESGAKRAERAPSGENMKEDARERRPPPPPVPGAPGGETEAADPGIRIELVDGPP